MTRKRGMATAFAAACLVLAGCAGPLNLMQESIYCDDARIAQGFDTYTVANRTGSLFDRKIGGLTGLETWLRISVPNEGGEFRVDYDATVQSRAKLVDDIESYAESDVYRLPNVGNNPSFVYILRNRTWQGGGE